MTNQKISGILTCWLLVLSASMLVHSAQAQNFAIKRIEQTPEEILIFYDLEDGEKNRSYLVQVFSSHDNFLNPLTQVSGDVGIDIRPGLSQKVIWNVKKEFGNLFRGDIQLEIRGKVYIPFIRFNSLARIKRTKETEITWSGNTDKNMLTFTLLRNNEQITAFRNIPNTGSATIKLPAQIKPGEGYYFMIADAVDQEHTVKTEEFKVTMRFPLAVKLAPAAVLVGIVVLLLPDKQPDEVGMPFNPPAQKN